MWKIFGSKEKFDKEEIKNISLKLDNLKLTSDALEIGQGQNYINIVCVSDTHSQFNNLKIPKCYLFIHAGDIINYNEDEKEFNNFLTWINQIKCKTKIIIGGNHDKYLQHNINKIKNKLNNIIYLEYNSYKYPNTNINIYGAPCILGRNLFYFGNAFSISGEEMANHWKSIPDNIDILITHCPPYDILDKTYKKQNLGSKLLKQEICNRIDPKLHIFGHNHDAGYNSILMGIFENRDKCLFVNACALERKEPIFIKYYY